MKTLIEEYVYHSELHFLKKEMDLYNKYKESCTPSQQNIYELGLLYWAYRFEETQQKEEHATLRDRLVENIIDRMEKCDLKRTRNVARFHTKLSREDKNSIRQENENTKEFSFSDHFKLDDVPPRHLFEMLNFAIANAPAEKLPNCATAFYAMVNAHQKQLAYSNIISSVHEFCLREDFEEKKQDEMAERLFRGEEFKLWRKKDHLDGLMKNVAQSAGRNGTFLSRKIEFEKICFDDEQRKIKENQEEFKKAKVEYLTKDMRNALAVTGGFVANCATFFVFEKKINAVMTPGFPKKKAFGIE